MKMLTIIPARKGSKGLPGKNTRVLAGKPLIQHSIEFALSLSDASDICVTSDDDAVLTIAAQCGIPHPLRRPDELASDTAGTREVMLHALDTYAERGVHYDAVVLLQPTSPIRRKQDAEAMLALFTDDVDLVVSVREAHDNPYFNLFEEDANGLLHLSKPSHFTRRQDCPKVYAYNGSIYIIRASRLREQPLSSFTRIRKYVMSAECSIDIDGEMDWRMAELVASGE
ncbi:MAG: cytidylyltransferase domain-containing protein [Flavobacteriales bacterium]|jgi:CMP-N,N'-diacetyllegionaminic acid synthase